MTVMLLMVLALEVKMAMPVTPKVLALMLVEVVLVMVVAVVATTATLCGRRQCPPRGGVLLFHVAVSPTSMSVFTFEISVDRTTRRDRQHAVSDDRCGHLPPFTYV